MDTDDVFGDCLLAATGREEEDIALSIFDAWKHCIHAVQIVSTEPPGELLIIYHRSPPYNSMLVPERCGVGASSSSQWTVWAIS